MTKVTEYVNIIIDIKIDIKRKVKQMKRINTASEIMINDFKKLKEQGITEFYCTVSNSVNNKIYKPVIKHTAQGVSAYVDKMFDKYGDIILVSVDYFDKKCNLHTYTIYGA